VADPLVKTEPPYVPIRKSAWPNRRFPRWGYLALAGLAVAAVLVALVHRPTTAERASDMRGFLRDVTGDIQSCAGGVRESLQALHLIEGGDNSAGNISNTITIAQSGAANCSPANNELIDDLDNYQVGESLASFRLGRAVSGLIAWGAPDAERVQTDVANVLTARTPQARTLAQQSLTQALAALDHQRADIDSVINGAVRALHIKASPPPLPG
jgi:hypothetical protein